MNVALRVAVCVLVAMGGSRPLTQSTASQLPTVVAAPLVISAIARQAKASGDVMLSVTTDGDRAVKIDVISGIPLLSTHAIESVKQWQFARHTPRTFTTNFRYRYKSPDRCPGADVETEVSARLPNEVVLTMPVFTIYSHGGPACGSRSDGKVLRLSKLEGTLTCECRSQSPIPDARVVVWQPGVLASSRVQLTSDSRGNFSADGLADGSYFVDIHRTGFRFKRLLVVVDPAAPAAGLRVAVWPEPHPDGIPPSVVPGQIAVYPESARVKGMEGDVTLVRQSPGQFSVVSGAGELATAALENARTWNFETAAEPGLQVVFRYRLTPGSCAPDSDSTVEMRLPTQVSISARRVVSCAPTEAGQRR